MITCDLILKQTYCNITASGSVTCPRCEKAMLESARIARRQHDAEQERIRRYAGRAS